jgi:hypothetical protein
MEERDLIKEINRLQDKETDEQIKRLLMFCTLLAKERNLVYIADIHHVLDKISEANGFYQSELLDYIDEYGG